MIPRRKRKEKPKYRKKSVQHGTGQINFRTQDGVATVQEFEKDMEATTRKMIDLIDPLRKELEEKYDLASAIIQINWNVTPKTSVFVQPVKDKQEGPRDWNKPVPTLEFKENKQSFTRTSSEDGRTKGIKREGK